MKNKTISILCSFLVACAPAGPEPFKIGKDACDHCKMTIMSHKNGMEWISEKGKIQKFDDISCGVSYLKDGHKEGNWYVADYIKGKLIPAPSAVYLKSQKLHTPMNSMTIAFSSKEEAQKQQSKSGGDILSWESVKELY